jgi:hypothetical protein
VAINIMAAVWKHSQYREEKLLVLLALADYANEDGVCWPSMRALAAKARITERGAQRIMRRLTADKVIEVLDPGGGRGHTAKYRIKGDPRNTECGNTVSTNTDCGDTKRVTVEARKGDPRDSAIRKEPSGTVIYPSGGRARGSARPPALPQSERDSLDLRRWQDEMKKRTAQPGEYVRDPDARWRADARSAAFASGVSPARLMELLRQHFPDDPNLDLLYPALRDGVAN